VTRPDYPSLESLARAFNAHRSGSGYAAKCPCHDDGIASMSIFEGVDKRHGWRRPFLHCHAGCDWRDLYADAERRGLWPRFEPGRRP
jgi:hypothetical protein